MADTRQAAAAPQSRVGRYELVIVGVVLVAASTAIGYLALQLAARRDFEADSSGTFPLIVGAGLILFSVLFLIQSIRQSDPQLIAHLAGERRSTRMRVVLWIALVLLGYALLVGGIGYPAGTAVLFVVVARLLGEKRWWLNIVVGVVLALAIYYGFTELLGVQLPAGLLEAVL
ncbi:tripartite tricarboxylate transporter TctB family protein [Jiangella mangrovi]|uniref:Putative tricarboxylic transport membrane protein n=1 Tax=Jiangella mangrovi TaxID=1524084 RepID=A0A7W9LIX8_9ACTN|nr:tripartite tricarboxylate transporter TctB family protein [Jiangella mangrovi]MBB5785502.1 putative tricarboxylic transport membrane protein [Jiangella mangrovi]